MIEKLRNLYQHRGFLSGLIIDEAEGMPSAAAYIHRFGSLIRAYEAVGFTPDRDYQFLEVNKFLRKLHPEIIGQTERAIAQLGGTVVRDPATDLLTVNREFSISVVLARCQTHDSGRLRWKVQVTFNPDVSIRIPRPVYTAVAINGTGRWRLNYGGIAYVDAPSLYPNDESGYVKLRYNSAGSTGNQSETFQFLPAFKLVPGVNAQVVTGTVLLSISGAQPWGDNGQGTLREFTTSGWVTRGTINYLSGDVALTSWTAGTNNAITRASCVTTVGENISSEFVFRTGAAPLRPGSLSIQYARAVGGTQSVTAGIDGKIDATGVSGSVDYETGLVRVRFGTMVTAAGNESQPWYAADRVGTDGKIFRPEPVAASSVRYSAVAYSYLPLDADLLGIDPVRLPSDGRVPIFRPGGFAVVGHTGKISGNEVTALDLDCSGTDGSGDVKLASTNLYLGGDARMVSAILG